MVQRKATRDTHIFGYSLPKVPETSWDRLKNIIGQDVPEQTRIKIQSAINEYVEQSFTLQDGLIRNKFFSRSKEAKTDLAIFRDFLTKTVKAWQKANEDETLQRMLSDFGAEMKVRSKGRLDISETMMNLETLCFSLELHLQQIQGNARPVSSASSKKAETKTIPAPEVTYINALADAFREMGIKVSKTVTTDNTKTPPVFRQTIEHLNTILDKDLKVGSSGQSRDKLIQHSLMK